MVNSPPQLTDDQRKALEEKIKNMSPEQLAELQKQQCIFCQIVSGKVPAKKVYEDDEILAVLDIAPAAKGHLLILPKEHFVIMPQLTDKKLGHLFLVARTLSQVLLKTLKVQGTSLFIANGLAAGQRAQHFLIHLIPRKEGDKVLDLQEKLIDQEILHKVKTAIENKLNEVLSIKTEIVSVEETVEKATEEEAGAKERTDKLETGKAAKNTKKMKTKRETKAKKGTKEETERETNGKKEDKVSIDDIARLFT